MYSKDHFVWMVLGSVDLVALAIISEGSGLGS